MAESSDRLSEPPAGSNHVVFLSVGEPSGDLHGAALARELRARIPGVRLIGLGGPRMASQGVELLAHVDDLAVMGFIEVISRLPFFFRIRRTVYAAIAAERVDLVIPVDYPGFNLPLARHARDTGRKVLYYVAPQVWAWHASRAKNLARDTDKVAVILPFEEAFLRERGASAEFVGHPLLDEPPETGDRGDWFARAGLDPDRPLLALMPGSRKQELRRHLDLFVKAADFLRRRRPELQVMIAAAAGLPDEMFAETPYRTTRDSRGLLAYATAALVKSGTTTLEAALAETPFVVAYRVNPISYQIARRVVRVPHIALANLVAGRRLVPEFIQDEATPEALSASLLPLLEIGGTERASMVAGLRGVRKVLGKGGAAKRVANMAADLLRVP